MKILFVATVYRHLVNFHIPYMQYFQQQGYKVYAVSSVDADRQILVDLGVECIDIPFSRTPLSPKNIKAYQELVSLFKRQQFELIHVNSPISALLTRFVYRKYKRPIVYTAHGFHFFEGAPRQNWLIYYPLEKIAARWTDHLFVINDEDYENAKKFIPVEKLSFVHGVGVKFTRQPADIVTLRRSLNIREDAVVITYIAELNSNKNHLYLLRNWGKIKSRCPKAVLLVIGTGESEAELKQYVQERYLGDVKFLGYRRDVEQLLHIAHINTLLSYREGLPKSTMESMYIGLPNVAINTRGLRDLVIDGENGYVISHDADEQLVESFITLIESAELRTKMGQQAQQMVKPYLLENVLPEYTRVYKNLLK